MQQWGGASALFSGSLDFAIHLLSSDIQRRCGGFQRKTKVSSITSTEEGTYFEAQQYRTPNKKTTNRKAGWPFQEDTKFGCRCTEVSVECTHYQLRNPAWTLDQLSCFLLVGVLSVIRTLVANNSYQVYEYIIPMFLGVWRLLLQF